MMIAGDIGGTKTNLALFEDEGGNYAFSHLATFHSRDYPSLKSILEEFLLQSKSLLGNKALTSACFAIAGPIQDGICKATNLPWIVDSKILAQAAGVSEVYLLNDLEANAYAIEILSKENLLTIYAGQKTREANRTVISPGTGLGEAGLYWDGKRHSPFACEGGHCEFGPRNTLQVELCSYLLNRFGHASYERILSGPGLVNLYMFFRDRMKRNEPSWLIEEMQKEDPPKVITQHALNGTSDLCIDALNLFASILGSEAGNCVLKFMALGGVYLGGGIPPKILPKLKENAFLDGFLDKGRFKDLLQEVPIYVILDDKAALRGAVHYLRLKKASLLDV